MSGQYAQCEFSHFDFKEIHCCGLPVWTEFSIVTPEQVDLVRKSFDALWPSHRRLAEVFYSRFFELAPDAQRLFPDDMERQQLKLMDMIAAIVGALDKREIFQSIISYTGRQHARFGVERSHFAAFGDALIWSLEQQFGPAFTPELKQAWITLYDAAQSQMIRAAQTQGDDAGPTLDDRQAARGKQCVQPRNGKRGWVRAPFSILTYVNIGSRQPELVFATNKTVRGIGTFLTGTTRNRIAPSLVVGMSPVSQKVAAMNDASACLKRAAECTRLAEATSDPEMKVYLLKLGLSWMQVATTARRDEQLLEEGHRRLKTRQVLVG